MKSKSLLLVLPVFLFAIYGCAENQTRIGEGTAIGGILGAAAGGIIGHQTDDTGAGVLIGGAIGAAGGAAVGAQIPKEQRVNSRSNQAVASSKLTMQQIVSLTGQGLTSDEIISRIRSTNSTYSLTEDDFTYLRNQGVSQRVVEAMQGAS